MKVFEYIALSMRRCISVARRGNDVCIVYVQTFDGSGVNALS